MGLQDSDFENIEEAIQYRLGEQYRKMTKTEGWIKLRNSIEARIKNLKYSLETCNIDEFYLLRGELAGLRKTLHEIDDTISEADSLELEIKKIKKED